MTTPLIPQETVRYTTHLKRSLVEALREPFANHPDEYLRKTKVDIDFPQDEADYPAIIVRYFGRTLSNAGVGHKEYIQGVRPEQPEAFTAFKHYLYSGTVEFAIYALSSYDRDLVGDSLVQILAMGDMEGWTNRFLNRIYHQSVQPDEVRDERGEITTLGYSLYHYINLNTDEISPFGESQVIAPWMPEDVLVYQTAYRVDASGEFYSPPPDENYPLIERVDTFPWIEGIDPEPEGAEDPAPWINESDNFDYTDF